MPTKKEVHNKAVLRQLRFSTLRNNSTLTYAEIGKMHGLSTNRAMVLCKIGDRRKLDYMRALEKKRLREYFQWNNP